MPEHTPDPGEVQQLLNSWLSACYPAWRSCSISADVGADVPLTVPVPRANVAAAGIAAAAPDADTIRSAVLDVLADTDHPLKATVLARRCERDYTGAFRRVLKRLVDEGEVIHDRQEKTFSLPDDV